MIPAASVLQSARFRSSGVASDALWYVLVTRSTVGYGDQYPVGTAGRELGSLSPLWASAYSARSPAQLGDADDEEAREQRRRCGNADIFERPTAVSRKPRNVQTSPRRAKYHIA
jgi:hypothetical protein